MQLQHQGGRSWQLARERWVLPAGGAVMGILNVTPDSFSDGGLHAGVDAALAHARLLVGHGADMIDVGGESTRPGAAEVAPEEEMRRTRPVIEALRAEFPGLRISIDTRHAEVARAALQAGADVVNDITGLASPEMRRLCAEMPCGVVLMHMQGSPETMQLAPQYADVVAEVRTFFVERLRLAQQAGIAAERICLDPGIGFGKTLEHNLALIRHLESLRVAGRPLLMALSRKRFMSELIGDTQLVRESPLPTVVMSLLAADRGADMHRVHDVAPLRQALVLRQALAE
ncbi:MAG: dihydropteroate synthase [Akkermansia sp.]|nr:dihydropteroate synthase [Akkermansia sp.]MBR2313359.1 dihydropteroate synthase [Akkermansia sp.]